MTIALPTQMEGETRQRRRLMRRRAGQYRAADPLWRWPPGSIVLGRTDTGDEVVQLASDRVLGTDIIGTSGGGKSRLAENMLRQDFLELDGVARGALLIDPHGTLVVNFVNWYVAHGLHEVRPLRILRAGDRKRVVHLNPLRCPPGVDPAVVAAAVVNAILRAWGGSDPTAMPQLRETLKCCMVALIELGLPLTEAGNLLDPADTSGLRAYARTKVRNPVVSRFLCSLDALRIADREAKVGSALRRMNEFLLPARIRAMFSDPARAIDWRQIMDGGEFVVLDLSYDTGRLSEDEAQVIGTMILAELFLASLGRSEDSIPFVTYIDECHRFLTADIAKFINEGRKHRASVVLIHQTMGQLRAAGDAVASAVKAARTKIIFNVEDADAAELARPLFRTEFDLSADKEHFRRPVVVGQELAWLLSESSGRGFARAVGTTSSSGGSQAEHRSKTKSNSTTISESDTISKSDTVSESETESFSHTDTRSSASSSSDGETSDAEDEPRGSFHSEGKSESEGSADTYGRSRATGSAHTEGRAHTSGVARTKSRAKTQGTTVSTNWSQGTSRTDTESRQRSQGRSQTYRSVFEERATVPYSLDELVHLASVRLVQLAPGEAIAKIGVQAPVQIATVHVKDGWARPEHIERVEAQLAAQTPYISLASEASLTEERREWQLATRIAAASDDPAFNESPPLKEGWG